MKRYITSNTKCEWEDLSGSEQYAVELARRLYESGEYGLPDAIHKACMDVGEANSLDEYSNEDFFLEDPDFFKVASYLRGRI